MPLTDSIPFVWRPRGLTDAIDGTNAFNGAMASLSNLIPDPSTEAVWMPRPPALSVTTFSSFTTPGFISAIKVIGNRVYGLIASGANAGHDEPFCYDLLTNTFITVSGITSGNTPTSPSTSGAWTPPIIEQAGSRIVVTHPGFPGGQTKFGWFDVSGYNQTTVGDLVSGSPIITGQPSILGVQPGMALAGTNIAGGATVLFAQDAYTATAFTGTSHGTFTIDGIASTAALLPGYFLVGPGIPPSTIIEQVLANSIVISFATTSSVTATFYAYGANPSVAGGYIGTTTAGSATVTTASTLGLWVGQSVVGVNIPLGSVIVSLVANTSITLNQAALGSGTQGFQVSGTVIVMSANATGTSNGGAINVAGGTFAAPQWGAGDTQPNNLPSVPVGVAQMAGRAYFALGTDGIVFSDSGFPCQVSNITRVQALVTGDGLAVTAIGPVMLATLTGGIVQCLIAFEGATKMQQITGDAATNNLAMNALPVATGTNAPLTVTPMELGLSFVSPEGLRIVEFSGRVTPPLGDHGMGITTAFIYTVVPSRMCSASASDTIRVTTQNGYKSGNPYEEYWYDLTRTIDGHSKVWHGPHTSTASLIEPWNDQFVMTFVGTNAQLFVSAAAPVASSTYIENGKQLIWQYEPVYLMPDNEQMSMNSLVEMTLACGGPNCSVLAPPEPLLYGPPLIGGPPVQPGPGPTGTPLVPNQPPPPPTQPTIPATFAVDAADQRFGAIWDMPHMADSSVGTLSVWLYLDSTVHTPPDLFTIIGGGTNGNLLTSRGTLPIELLFSHLMTFQGAYAVPIQSISRTNPAIITFYGTAPLSQFLTVGSKVYLQIGDPNPGWPASPGLVDVIASSGSQITVNFDTSAAPAPYVPTTTFQNMGLCYVGQITGITSATAAVISLTVPHGIDPADIAAGHVYLTFINYGSPAPGPGSGWNTINANTIIKVTGSTSTSLTTDLNSTGFTAWNTIGQYQVAIGILNSLTIQVQSASWNSAPDPTTDPNYFFEKVYNKVLPWDRWVNLICAWDTNHGVEAKTMNVSLGETVLTPVFTTDPCPAFTIPYSESLAVSLSWAGGTATGTTTKDYLYNPGTYTFVIENATRAGYNGTHTVTFTGATTFTYALVADPGGTATGDFYQAATAISSPVSPAHWTALFETQSYFAEYYWNPAANLDPSVAANRHLFHDAVTGKAISLGADGSMPTGSPPIAYLSLVPAALTPPPALVWVDANGNELWQNPGVLGSIGDSTSMVLSFWIDRNFAQGNNGNVLIHGPGSAVQINNYVNPQLVTVSLNNSIGQTFAFTFPISPGTGANVRMSVDTNHGIGAKIVHVFVGTTEVTTTVIQDDIGNLSVNWQNGANPFWAIQDAGGYIAALWFGPGQLFDVSTKFVDGSGNPVDLGANGQLPSGTAPACYFNATAGDATTFYTNHGLGGAFTFNSNVGSTFILTTGARITDNKAGTGAMIESLFSTDTNYGALLLAPSSPTD